VTGSRTQITPVILCGGSGTRLWPRSRAHKPKPFLPLVQDETLFQQALGRCGNPAHFGPPIVVTGSQHVEHVEAQLSSAPGAQVIVEPMAKNTAAAIALAAMRLPADAIMLICPSDHHIGDADAFLKTALAAAELASNGWLVSFGIRPTGPDTGFGYLRHGEPIETMGLRVAEFVEKPDSARAQDYFESGNFSWNGGIFAFRVGDYLTELKTHRPELEAAVREAVAGGKTVEGRFLPEADAFRRIASESVDYAVMENTGRAAMVPADMSWSDIGNWRALHDARERDELGNTVRGPVELVNCRDVLVDSDGPRVSAIGLKNVIVVIDGGEVMITTTEHAHLVGHLSGAANQ
jgi:mannose-1-phosphate guanylyltransferase/mannose-1-phosphate guanylyltransferase/mannose-6-phosphate isomerase